MSRTAASASLAARLACLLSLLLLLVGCSGGEATSDAEDEAAPVASNTPAPRRLNVAPPPVKAGGAQPTVTQQVNADVVGDPAPESDMADSATTISTPSNPKKKQRERKTVEVVLATPEQAFETYRQAWVHGDWKAVINCVTPESQAGLLGTAFSIIGSSVSGTQEEIRAYEAKAEEIVQKYGIRSSDLYRPQVMQKLKAMPNKADAYYEVTEFVRSPQNSRQTYDDWDLERWESLVVESVDITPKRAVVKCKPTGKDPKRLEYPVYILEKSGDQWLVNTVESELETRKLSYANSEQGKKAAQENAASTSPGTSDASPTTLGNPTTTADKTPVEIKLSTPEEAFETHRQGNIKNDWKAVIQSTAPIEHSPMFTDSAHEVNRTQLRGSAEDQSKAAEARDQIWKKHKIDPEDLKSATRVSNLTKVTGL
ncbi:MAG: hypothetical protein SGJ20_12190 [Planctomycetota bacterium]|nr:hypothetical protein [Planctomycetota bacterium]